MLLMAAGLFSPVVPTAEWGYFSGEPVAFLTSEGRNLRLGEDFLYTDRRGKKWMAKKDSIVNGASIPQIFWSVTGGPLEGKFRNASIIHDAACDRRSEAWEEVHLAFYEACRCGGVGERQAKMLYAAVYHFGPRWHKRTWEEFFEDKFPRWRRQVAYVSTLRHKDEEEEARRAKAMLKLLEDEELSLDAIRELDLNAL